MYNYSDLNDVEFEELCKDIMKKKLNMDLRTFSRGKDRGIDIRNSENNIIIQVKHYYKSLYSTLKKELLNELEKVKKLNPKQYYICVSQSLSPMQIDEVYKMFDKYMDSDANIITIKEIDDFLNKEENQEVVNKHYKLWLSSSKVLDKIGQNDIFIDCESLISDINEEVRYFVKTNMFDKCLEILENERLIAIVGMPGVGKTTTSKMLILKYVEKGYIVRHSTNNDIANLKKSISSNPDVKEIILLDDCLGQHYLKMEEKQENEIISLIKYVNLHKNKILIMNSRITIFNEAKERSEEFNSIVEDKKIKIYTINMNNIDFVEKAKILYNHLYFNQIENEYFEEIKKDKRYLRIVKHRNYNPRIIQNITKKSKVNMEKREYYNYILECLENPQYIWKNEFYNRIEKEDRILLLVLYSLSDEMVNYSLLEKAFNSRIEEESIDTSKNCFSEVIKRLNESMIRIIIKGKDRYISVLNPSVNDFLSEEFNRNKIELHNILRKAISIEQIDRIYNKNWQDKDEYIKTKIEDGSIMNYTYLNSNRNVYSLILTYIIHFNIKSEQYEKIIEKGFLDYDYDYIVGNNIRYEKGKAVRRLLNSPLYDYYKIFDKLNDKEFVEALISNVYIKDLVEITYRIDNKFIVNIKRIPEEILRVIVYEINYALELFLEEFELDSLSIDVNELFYDKRKEIEESLGREIYEITEDEFDKELMDAVEEEIENKAIEEYESIKNKTCMKLPDDIKKRISYSYVYFSKDNLRSFISRSLEIPKDYDLDSIIQNDEDEIDEEIEKIFNREYEIK